MERSVQLAVFLLLSFPVLSLARGGPRSSHSASGAATFCSVTRDPRLCMATSETAGNIPMSSKGVETTLRKNLVAISNRCVSAKNRALQLVQRAPLATRTGLKECVDLYANAVDLVGVSIRALNANDGQTGQMVQIMLQQVRQSAQECNARFVRQGANNPLAHLNGSLVKMTLNADDLNNFMTRQNAARKA